MFIVYVKMKKVMLCVIVLGSVTLVAMGALLIHHSIIPYISLPCLYQENIKSECLTIKDRAGISYYLTLNAHVIIKNTSFTTLSNNICYDERCSICSCQYIKGFQYYCWYVGDKMKMDCHQPEDIRESGYVGGIVLVILSLLIGLTTLSMTIYTIYIERQQYEVRIHENTELFINV